MKIIYESNLKIVVPKGGYMLKGKDDNYVPESIDENGNKIEEHIPYYFDKAYIPENMTLNDVSRLYEEIEESVTEGE